jgi:hypothetical protein
MLVANYTLLDNPNSYENDIFKGTVDLTRLKWELDRDAPESTDLFLKTTVETNHKRWTLKMSAYNPQDLVHGYEAVFEFIASRVAEHLEIKHQHCYLLPARVKVNDLEFDTLVCASQRNTPNGCINITFESYYIKFNTINQNPDNFIFKWLERESSKDEPIDHAYLCKYMRQMILFDYIIYNRYRKSKIVRMHYNKSKDIYTLAPLFDQGNCLLAPLHDDYTQVDKKYMLNSLPVTTFLGSANLERNLITYCKGRIRLRLRKVYNCNFTYGLEEYMSPDKLKLINDMIKIRWQNAINILISQD